jgi:hypothetical protein
MYRKRFDSVGYEDGITNRLALMRNEVMNVMKANKRQATVEGYTDGRCDVLFIDRRDQISVTHAMGTMPTADGRVRVFAGPNYLFAKYFDNGAPELSANLPTAQIVISAFAMPMCMTARDIKMPSYADGIVEFTLDASEIESGLFGLMKSFGFELF